MKFEYQALDAHGKLVNGTEEVKNFKELITVLFQKKIRPFDVRRVGESRQKSYGDLERLKKLKKRIKNVEEPEQDESEHDPLPIPNLPKRSWNIDYYYLLYLVIIVGLLIAASQSL
jgi:hypothetical protein